MALSITGLPSPVAGSFGILGAVSLGLGLVIEVASIFIDLSQLNKERSKPAQLPSVTEVSRGLWHCVGRTCSEKRKSAQTPGAGGPLLRERTNMPTTTRTAATPAAKIHAVIQTVGLPFPFELATPAKAGICDGW